MTTQSTFKALDHYILRAPVLSANVFEQKLTSFKGPILDEVKDLMQNPLIREAIAISSLSLLDALTSLSPDSSARKQEQISTAFLRYVIRMATRPTPFGLFSGVTYGKYGENLNLSFESIEQHKKRTRPDMDWIFQIVAQLENDPQIIPQLWVTKNTLAYEVGERTYLPYLAQIGEVRERDAAYEIQRASVLTTSAVEQALQFATEPIKVETLVSKLQREYPDTSHEQISQFVYDLLKQELLISNLRPPLVDVNPLHYLIEVVQQLPTELKVKLKEISMLIDKYDNVVLGKGEQLYRTIIKKMKEVAHSSNFLQVDLKIESDDVVLPYSVKEEVEEVANVLWSISNHELSTSYMSDYSNDFIEKYGMAREVPLLELLDEEIGLGAPATYLYPPSKRKMNSHQTEFQQQKKFLLSQWVTKVLFNEEQELVLDEDKIAQLAGDHEDSADAPRSFELYFSLVKHAEQEREGDEDYRLISGSGTISYGAGKSIGRFTDLFPSSFRDELHRIGTLEQEMCPDAILAELVYLPIEGRAANVVLTHHNRNYEIIMGTTSSKEKEHSIPLSDLVVGFDENGLYLRSLKLGKEVIPVTNHMFNASHAPNVYRFLRELGQERQKNIEPFHWGELNALPFLPRVRYKRCILSPARWVLNEQTFSNDLSINKVEWMQQFQQYKREWKLPRYVYLTQSDNSLLLDLNESEHIDEIRRECMKPSAEPGITLTEVGQSIDNLPLSNKHKYFTEIVFPLIKNDHVKKRKAIAKKPMKPIRDPQRVKLPGSEWMFVKWYGVGQHVEEFIGGQLRDFCVAAEQNKWIDSSFFMRYADPDPHIRLRFWGNPETLQRELLPKLHQFAHHCIQQGFISRMTMDTYDPEIERFGGPDLMPLAEQWFCMDSSMVMDWIMLHEQGQLPIHKDLLTVISIIHIMEQFGFTFDEQLAFLNKMVSYKAYLDVFRPQRSIYMKLGDARDEFAQLKNHEVGQILIPGFQARNPLLHEYGLQLAKQEKSNAYYTTRMDAMHSIIHLHINRLYGIDRTDETRVLTLTRHTLHNLVYIRRG
ncbi:lantibiotic dehydratase [Longirhabdus pacifica]|uniref:lantibiotic dehydratase n=1 Tax=Longirhabdus pacifica TaxID=2305227 RepID=UPI001008C6D2|nr:lantibiotic dehydratase [Longirhabdus pacifica]